MALDLDKLKHYADFNITTEALGAIRCGPFTSEDLSEFGQLARAAQVDGATLARKLIQSIARKVTGDDAIDVVCGGPILTEPEVAEISSSELDDFSNQFMMRRLRASPDEYPGNTATEPRKASCDQLAHAITTHIDSQRAQLESILGQTRASILGGSTIEAARKYGVGGTAAELARKMGVGNTAAELARKMGVGNTAAELASKYGAGNTAAELASKYGVGNTAAELASKYGAGNTIVELARKMRMGNTAAELARRNMLESSALNAALRTIQASDNLGESIAALRASETTSMHYPKPIDLSIPNFSQPPNPILETNRLLREQQTYAEEMRPTIIRSAELIRTLTDTTLATQAFANDNSAQAERHAKRSMQVAIASIFISVVASSISIYYANASPTAQQADKLAKNLGTQISAIIVEAKEDRAAFEKSAKEDRTTLAAAINQQVEITKARSDKGGKTNHPNSNKQK